jgi:hypothetical protein
MRSSSEKQSAGTHTPEVAGSSPASANRNRHPWGGNTNTRAGADRCWLIPDARSELFLRPWFPAGTTLDNFRRTMTDPLIEELKHAVDTAGGTGERMCPVCYMRIADSAAKTQHLLKVHGYEILQLRYPDGSPA